MMPLVLLDRSALLERVALALSRIGIVPPPFPVPFFDAYLATMTTRAVMAATSLGVFAALAEKPDDAAGLAERTGLVEDRLEILLALLVTIGYVRPHRGRYRLSRSAKRWLAPTSRHRIDAVVGGLTYWNWRGMDALEDVLRGGEPIGLHGRPADDPLWPDYQAAMAQLAGFTADTVSRIVPAEHPRRLLDLAGGPGMHAAAMCRRHADLEATVVELEAPAALARERLAREGLADRIHYVTGDLFEVELGTDYDVVTAHSILHNLDAEHCVELLRSARGALRPGGCVAALEVEQPAPGRPGSLIATAGSLAFLAYTGTRSWTRIELREFFARAGLVRIEERHPPRLPGNVILLGRRPD